MNSAFNTAALPVRFEYMSIWTALIPSRVGCSFLSKLFSISKLLCLVFVLYYLFFALETVYSFLFHLDVRERISLGDTRFVLLMQAINLSRLSQRTQTSVSYCALLLSRKSYTVYMYLYCAEILSTPGCRQTA